MALAQSCPFLSDDGIVSLQTHFSTATNSVFQCYWTGTKRLVLTWMIYLLQQILWIARKEIRYALRDTDVLIYAVLVPLLVYPVLIVCAGELFMWQLSAPEQKYKVAISGQLPDRFYSAVANAQHCQIVASPNAMHSLHVGKLDVVLNSESVADKYRFVAYIAGKRGYMAASMIEKAVRETQAKTAAAAMKAKHVPPELLKICQVKKIRIVPTAPVKANEEKQPPIVLLCAVLVGFLQAGLTGGISAVCMLAEEKEKKTFETTMLLPVSGQSLVVGKWLAACLLTLVSAVGNIITVGGTYVVMAAQASMMSKTEWKEILPFLVIEPRAACLAALTLVVGCAFGCSLCMLCVSACRSFKEAQALATYPMFLLLLVPMVALIPGIEEYPSVSFVPLVNLLILVKHPSVNPLYLVGAVLESALLTYFCLSCAGKIFFSEKSLLLSGGTSGQRPHQQAESV